MSSHKGLDVHTIDLSFTEVDLFLLEIQVGHRQGMIVRDPFEFDIGIFYGDLKRSLMGIKSFGQVDEHLKSVGQRTFLDLHPRDIGSFLGGLQAILGVHDHHICLDLGLLDHCIGLGSGDIP